MNSPMSCRQLVAASTSERHVELVVLACHQAHATQRRRGCRRSAARIASLQCSKVQCRAKDGNISRPQASTSPTDAVTEEAEEVPRDDDVLPDSLGDALLQAGEATNQALQGGVTRCLVEVLLPEFWDPVSGAVFAEEGDQQRFWKLTRRFIDSLAASKSNRQIRVVYPDMGVAAMLKNSWRDIPHKVSSLGDRKPIQAEDELVVIAAPDPQGLDMCRKIAAELEDQRPLVLFNPRLASGDVGIGLNVRRMRSQFLSTFNTTYSLRPVEGIGSVFRRYPDMWKVFIDDKESPGRFRLIAERASRPAGEALDNLLFDALGQQQGSGDGESNSSLFGQIQSTIQSLQRFAKQLSQ